MAFATAILLGAGTDYTVFLISRYHEQRRAQTPADQAVVHATASIGRVILASAATVAFAFLTMVFARLSVFAALGPGQRARSPCWSGSPRPSRCCHRCWCWPPDEASANRNPTAPALLE